MKFHHHGYVSGDPRRSPDAQATEWPTEIPDEVDVLIVGAGPAGMIAAAQLSVIPGVTTRVIDRRPGRLEVGQADGIQARSVETFQAFGFADRISEEAFHITETAFWRPDPEDPERIVRAGRTVDDETGISEFPHLIVNQARILDNFAEFMANSPSRMRPDYGWEFTGLRREGDVVHVTIRDTDGRERTVRARYVVGADGAHSKVRAAIGRTMTGDAANHAWGVMDVVAATDFPDIRRKCAIQSSHGAILHIPREGGHLFRMYVDLGEVPVDDDHAVRRTPLDEVIRRANEILHPYTLDVRDVAWNSVYEVGHRLTDRFDDDADDPRVFILGDACHTHSAKAGQGMNVSMQDGFNLAWKLAYVLTGRSPEELLRTYSSERTEVAANLIAFDREWSSMMTRPVDDPRDAAEIERFYIAGEEFSNGFLTEYPPSLATDGTEDQAVATGYPVGRRFHSVEVNRLCDAYPVHLGHEATADGRWCVYVFGDVAETPVGPRLQRWADWWQESPDSPRVRCTGEGDDDALFDARVVLPCDHRAVDTTDVPRGFRPEVGPFHLTDLGKAYCVLPGHDTWAERGISRDGAVVLVRPDQYVAGVYALDDTDALAAFLRPVLLTAS